MNDIELRKWCLEFAVKTSELFDDYTYIDDAEKIYNWVTQDQSTGNESTNGDKEEGESIFYSINNDPVQEAINRSKIPNNIRTRCVIDFPSNNELAFQTFDKFVYKDFYMDYNTEAINSEQVDKLLFHDLLLPAEGDKKPNINETSLDALKQSVLQAEFNAHFDGNPPITDGEPLASQAHDNPKDHKWVLMGEAKEYYESLKKEPLGFDPILLATLEELDFPNWEQFQDGMIGKECGTGTFICSADYLYEYLEFPEYIIKEWFDNANITEENHLFLLNKYNFDTKKPYRGSDAMFFARNKDNIEQLREQYKDEIQARLKA